MTLRDSTVLTEEFRVVTGRELIKEYESSQGNLRAFCSRCGSLLYGTVADVPSIRRMRLGTLDNVERAKSVAHIWTGSKSEWFDITDHLEQFEGEPPGKYFRLEE